MWITTGVYAAQLRTGTPKNVLSCCLKALGEWNNVLFNNRVPQAYRSIIQDRTSLWSKEEGDNCCWAALHVDFLQQLTMVQRGSNVLTTVGWRKFGKDAVWRALGPSLASCIPERCILMGSFHVCVVCVCVCLCVTSNTGSFEKALQLSSLPELRIPLWFCRSTFLCTCTATQRRRKPD